MLSENYCLLLGTEIVHGQILAPISALELVYCLNIHGILGWLLQQFITKSSKATVYLITGPWEKLLACIDHMIVAMFTECTWEASLVKWQWRKSYQKELILAQTKLVLGVSFKEILQVNQSCISDKAARQTTEDWDSTDRLSKGKPVWAREKHGKILSRNNHYYLRIWGEIFICSIWMYPGAKVFVISSRCPYLIIIFDDQFWDNKTT